MKKTLKALLCVVLALSMVLSFAACSKDDTKGADSEQAKNAEDGEKASREVLEKYLDAAVEMNTKEAAKYTNADVDDDELFEDGYEEMKKQLLAEMGEDAYAEEIADIMVNTLKDSMKYEIKDCKKDGDDYVYTVEVEAISFSEIQEVYDELDKNAIMNEAIEKAIEEGIIESVDEEITEEQSEALTELGAECALEAIKESLANLEAEADEEEFTVINVDGEWVVDVES